MGWSGTWYSDYSDLSRNRVSLSGGVYGRLVEGWVASVVASAGGSFHGDADRDSFDLSGRLGLRWQAHERIALRPGYTLLWNEARASEFDRTAHRFSLGLDTYLGRDTWLYLGSAIELGEVPRYLDLPASSSTGGSGPGGGGPGTSGPMSGSRDPMGRRVTETFGVSQVVARTDATIVDVTLDFEKVLTRWLIARAGGGYSRVWADPENYDVFLVSGSLGVQWP